MDELLSLIELLGLEYAYDHFAEGENPTPPFLCFLLPNSNNFAADGIVYQKFSEVHIELYTTKKNPTLEKSIEDKLDANEIFYNIRSTTIFR